jgi:hypothetical protein
LCARPTALRTASTMTMSALGSRLLQFRRGLLFMSMYCMRSWVFGSPQSERKASRSSSSSSASVTGARRAVDAAAEHLGDLAARSSRRARWPGRRRPACRPSSSAWRCRSRPGACRRRRRRVVARCGEAEGALLGLVRCRARSKRRRPCAEEAELFASSALVATLARAMFLNTCVTTAYVSTCDALGDGLERAPEQVEQPPPPGMRPTPTSTRPE